MGVRREWMARFSVLRIHPPFMWVICWWYLLWVTWISWKQRSVYRSGCFGIFSVWVRKNLGLWRNMLSGEDLGIVIVVKDEEYSKNLFLLIFSQSFVLIWLRIYLNTQKHEEILHNSQRWYCNKVTVKLWTQEQLT